LRRRLAERLKPDRFAHVMGVEGMCVLLAARWGVDPNRTMLAALLHDYCKGEDKHALKACLADCTRFPPCEADLEHPEVWHGLAAAAVAEQEFGVQDVDVLHAVAYHTTGVPQMGPVALTLYVADTFEPTRRYEGVEALRRQVLASSLKDAALLAARTKLELLRERPKRIHPNTTALSDWLQSVGTIPSGDSSPRD
jgi:predicted HD superfamily hydrolase involved in NAD metabolism